MDSYAFCQALVFYCLTSYLFFFLLPLGSTVLETTIGRLTHDNFLNLIRHSVGLLRTSVEPVAKDSTYPGQHNTEIQGQIFILNEIRTNDLRVQAIKTYSSDRAATGTFTSYRSVK
jgi:hypothetical protein